MTYSGPLTDKVIMAAGTTTATASLTDGIDPNELIVIDWIKAFLVAGTTSATLDANGFRLATVPVAAGGASFDFDFANGFPCWSASNTDATPATSVTVVVAGGGVPTDAEVTVGYHYERPSQRREWQ